jgi:predicted enzyme related to lactoylglutathione lyase
MNRNPVVWFEIYVQDMQRARKFYETVLAIELTPLGSPMPDLEMLAFPMHMNGEGASGALARMDGCPSGGMGTLVYFACEDCAVEASRVEAAGGKICKPKFSIGQYGFIALVSDTEGNMIGLHSMQ